MSTKHLSCESSVGSVPSKGVQAQPLESDWGSQMGLLFLSALALLPEMVHRKLLLEWEEQQKEQRNRGRKREPQLTFQNIIAPSNLTVC